VRRPLDAEFRFAELARDKILLGARHFYWKPSQDKLQDIVKHCSRQFRRQVLFALTGDERGQEKWAVEDVDVPQGFPYIERGVLHFTFDELQKCLSPAVDRIDELLASALNKSNQAQPNAAQISVSTVIDFLRQGDGVNSC
jgi:hypothetical protein